MRNKVLFASLIFALFMDNAFSDTVQEVYSCGNDIGIKTVANGWLVVKENEVGPERVNRILSIALTLLSTQKPIGYYNASTSST